jgi:hypothetical protein
VNPELQIAGERLAKSVVLRTEALEALRAPRPKLALWHMFLTAVIGAGIAWLGAHAGANSVFAIGIAAEVGFLLAVTAYVECIRLRRRLDAAVVLLLERDRFTSEA